MARRMSIRAELDQLREELTSLRDEKVKSAAAAAAADEVPPKHHKDLQALVQSLIDDAEDAVGEHPVASIATALALGIVIGRLSCR